MAEFDDPAEAAARLERALDRIERLARAPQSPAAADTVQIKARLDGLIAELRAVLGSPGST